MENENKCTCGCHDGHEHDHDHKHLHEHEHEHEHGGYVEITTHEKALVATYRFQIEGKDREELKEKASGFIENVGKAVTEKGGLIGHIKAAADYSFEGLRLSLTDEAIDILPLTNCKAYVEGVAIVFLIDHEALEEIVNKEIKKSAEL